MDFHKTWIKQCEEAKGIEDEFGADKALKGNNPATPAVLSPEAVSPAPR
jgi:hypothetical protein